MYLFNRNLVTEYISDSVLCFGGSLCNTETVFVEIGQ